MVANETDGDKEHLTFKYQMGGVHCREREPEHVMKTAYIEELRTCPEKTSSLPCDRKFLFTQQVYVTQF